MIWLSIIISLICLVLIIMIASRHFAQLAILDVANMPVEKENRVKSRIIKKRLRRDLSRVSGAFGGLKKMLGNGVDFLADWLEKLRALEHEHYTALKLASATRGEQISLLLKEAEELIAKDDSTTLAGAENKLIDIIALDKKNLPAFLALADVYEKSKKNLEARQTYEYCLKLLESANDQNREATVNFSLALVKENLGDLDGAADNIIESLRIEPNNPRFLDALLDLCILRKDQASALEVLERLERVNPDNQKLIERRAAIEALVK